jgi:hypothetical protein
MAKQRDFGPVQLANWLDLAPRELRRAQNLGLIPAPDIQGERWSETLAKALPDRVERIRTALSEDQEAGHSPAPAKPSGATSPTSTRPPKDKGRTFGPIQLANWLGLKQWQINYAQARGLIPCPDIDDRRWSETLAKTLPDRVEEIRAAVGDHPGYGSVNAARYLATHSGLEVERADVHALVGLGLLRPVGEYRGNPMYSIDDLEGLTNEQITTAIQIRLDWIEESLTAPEAAALLGWSVGKFEVTAERNGVTPHADGRYPRDDVLPLAEAHRSD